MDPAVPDLPCIEEGSLTKQVDVDPATTRIVTFQRVEAQPFALPIQLRVLGPAPAKINLVLDIDLTLIHAVPDPGAAELREDGRVKYFRYRDRQMAIVVRPELRLFLETVSQFADLFAYTHGERMYANILLDQFIDPERKFISRSRFFAVDKDKERSKTKALQKYSSLLEHAIVSSRSSQSESAAQSLTTR